MSRGDMQECSFAFTVDPTNIDVEKVSDTEVVEIIRSVEELFDVSCVVRGAYSQTFSVYRHAVDANEIERAVEKAFSKQNPKPLETHLGDGGEADQESESRTANDFDIDLALAELDLNYKSTLILGS